MIMKIIHGESEEKKVMGHLGISLYFDASNFHSWKVDIYSPNQEYLGFLTQENTSFEKLWKEVGRMLINPHRLDYHNEECTWDFIDMKDMGFHFFKDSIVDKHEKEFVDNDYIHLKNQEEFGMSYINYMIKYLSQLWS